MLSTFIFIVGNFLNHCSKLRSVKRTNRFEDLSSRLKVNFRLFSFRRNFPDFHCLKSFKNILIQVFEI